MTRSRFLWRVAGGVLVVAVACDGGALVAPGHGPSHASAVADRSPGSDGQGGLASTPGMLDGALRSALAPVKCAPHAPVVGQGVFGPPGGVLQVGDSRLIIPGGALRETVVITGTSLGDGSSTIDFQPEGLHFRHPARLDLSGANCTLPADGAANLVLLSPNGEVEESIPASYSPRWKLVSAPIWHFSGYAIAF